MLSFLHFRGQKHKHLEPFWFVFAARASLHMLLLNSESPPSTLLGRSGALGVPLAVPYYYDITTVPQVNQGGREERDCYQDLLLSHKTSRGAFVEITDRRWRDVFVIYALFSSLISGLG